MWWHAAGASLLVVAAFAAAPLAAAPASGILGETDRRVPLEPTAWPFTAIGRVNVVTGPGHRGHCTGTLVGPRHVLTAAHCFYDARLATMVKPHQVHFVAGQARDRNGGSSVAAAIRVARGFDLRTAPDAPSGTMARAMLGRDWAIVTLAEAIPGVKPVPVRVLPTTSLPDGAPGAVVALAGYARDRPYLPSIHRGCAARLDAPEPGLLASRCDSLPGESGSAVLLLEPDGAAAIVGIQTAVGRDGNGAPLGLGVAAATFAPSLDETLRE
ncbi:MAG: trypsin-like serine protease [Methylobacterium frigidaeris]